MNRFRFDRALRVVAALAFAALSGQAAQAEVHLSNHQSFYAFDFTNAQVQYDAYDTVTADKSGDAATITVPILGDPSTFAWDAAGTFPGTDVTASNLSVGSNSASATLTVTGSNTLIGESHYGYLSNEGQGLLTDAGSSLDFNAIGSDLAFGDQINLVLPGDWVVGTIPAGSDSIWSANAISNGSLGFTLNGDNTITGLFLPNNLVITNNFTYDPTLGATFFSAQVTPEPGAVALLAGLFVSSAGLIARRRRR